MKKILEAKDKKKNVDETLDVLLILATFKVLHEQLYCLKGVYSGMLKRKFNIVLKAFRLFEMEIDDDYLKENKVFIDQLYDAMAQMSYMIKESVIEQGNYEKNDSYENS